MEEKPGIKKLSKIKDGTNNEDESKLKEYTPIKFRSPQAHSTPVETGKVERESLVTETEDKNISDDEDGQWSPVLLNCTQNSLTVGWDYGSPRRKLSKKIGSKAKRKLSKGDSFVQRKQNLKSTSPVEPLCARRRFNIQEPVANFSNLLFELRTLTDQVKNLAGQNTEMVQCSSHNRDGALTIGNVVIKENATSETSGKTHKKEDLILDIPVDEREVYISDTQQLRENCKTPPLPNLDLIKDVQNEINNETFTAFLDDNEDECMMKCTQEIEEKLTKKMPVVTSDRLKIHSAGDINNEEVKRFKNINPKVEVLGRNSPRGLKNSNNNKNSPKRGTRYYVRVKSRTPKRSSITNPNTVLQTCHVRKSPGSVIINSKAATTQDFAFDDSFDAVIQNFTEEDVEKLSQGVPVEKKDTNAVILTEENRQSYKNAEEGTRVNWKEGSVVKSSAGKSSLVQKVPINNSSLVHSSRHLEQVNERTSLNKVGESSKKVPFRLKAPSMLCNNPSVLNQPNDVHLKNSCCDEGLPIKKFVQKQGQSNINAPNKSSNTVRPYPCTNSNTLACNAMPKLSPQKYTPEEIQKKRLEAKKKLEKKKLAMCGRDKKYRHTKGS